MAKYSTQIRKIKKLFMYPFGIDRNILPHFLAVGKNKNSAFNQF